MDLQLHAPDFSFFVQLESGKEKEEQGQKEKRPLFVGFQKSNVGFVLACSADAGKRQSRYLLVMFSRPGLIFGL